MTITSGKNTSMNTGNIHEDQYVVWYPMGYDHQPGQMYSVDWAKYQRMENHMIIQRILNDD